MLKSFAFVLFIFTFNAFAQLRPIEEIREPVGTYSSEKYAKVAILQWAPSENAPLADQAAADKFKSENILTLEKYIREAAANGAELIITPEFGIVGYPDIPELPSNEDNFRNREDISPYVEGLPGAASHHFGQLAKELGVYIHFGLAEVDKFTQRYYNAVAVVGPSGFLVATYRKQHLFQIEYDYLTSGVQNTVYDSPFGKIGIIICSDVYDFGVLANYRAQKIDVLALSTSWTEHNSGWGYFTRGATRTSATMLISNHDYYPDSGVINSDGSVQSHIRQSSGLAYGYILRK